MNLKKLSEKEVKAFIRGVLKRTVSTEDYLMTDGKETPDGIRFDMGMCNSMGKGIMQKINLHNNKILEKFDFCGIYDHTLVLYLTSWKGNINIVYSYDGVTVFNTAETQPYGGITTTEIIYEVFKLTILK